MLETESDEQDLEHDRAHYYKMVADELFFAVFFLLKKKNEMFPIQYSRTSFETTATLGTEDSGRCEEVTVMGR